MIARAALLAACLALPLPLAAQDTDREMKVRIRVAQAIKRLSSDDEAVRAAGVEVLVTAGVHAIPQLVARRDVEDETLRARVRAVLARLGETPERTARRIDTLLAAVRTPDEEPETLWMGSARLESRSKAMATLLDYGPAGVPRLSALLAEAGGPVEPTLRIEPPRPRMGQLVTIHIGLHNKGKTGVWIRRPLRLTAGWRSLQRHITLVSEIPEIEADEGDGSGAGGEGDEGLPVQMRHYGYIPAGKTLRFTPQVRTASFGMVQGKLDLPPSRLKKVPVIGRHRTGLIPYRPAVRAEAKAYVLPASEGVASGKLTLGVARGPAHETKLLLDVSLVSSADRTMRVWNIVSSRHALWWVMRRGDRHVASGWFSGLKDSYADRPYVVPRVGTLRELGPGKTLKSRVGIPHPEAGEYQIQIGLGPIVSGLEPGDTPVWVGQLVSKPLTLTVE